MSDNDLAAISLFRNLYYFQNLVIGEAGVAFPAYLYFLLLGRRSQC